MLESFLLRHPQTPAYLLSVDGPLASPVLARLGVKLLHPADLRLAEFSDMQRRYTPFELCNALKPFLLRYLLTQTSHDKICYFDGDIYVFDSLQEAIWDQLDAYTILLTPHLYLTPADDAAMVGRDLAVLQHGVYNGGFVGLRRSADADRFVRWWGVRTLTAGYKRLDEGLNCDQRWLDLLPGFDLRLGILRHPGLNVAYWNLYERHLTYVGGRPLVNGQPLLFYHFSGYIPNHPEMITTNGTPFTFANRPDLKPIFQIYAAHFARIRQQHALQIALPGGPSRASDIRSSQLPVRRELQDAIQPPAGGEAVLALPPITVIIPAYNAARYLPEAIDSVLQQTAPDLEIIVVDDGSTDDTAAILAPYLDRHGDRIQLLQQQNAGVSAARNRGIQAARGELIAFLDADDTFLLPTKLAEQAVLFAGRPEVGIAHCGWRVVDEDGVVLSEKRPWQQARDFGLREWLLWQPALPSAMMFRRDDLIRVGGFDAGLAHLEDVDLVFRLLLQGCATRWLPKIAVLYRRHAGSASARIEKQEQAQFLVLDRLFAQPLPDDIRALEPAVRFGAWVWMAFRFFGVGRYAEMAQRLEASLPYAPHRSASATLCHWMEFFQANAATEFRQPFSAFALTDLPEWQELLHTHVLSLPNA